MSSNKRCAAVERPTVVVRFFTPERSLRVLIVDDDPKAVDDLIVLDLMMPDVNGFDVVEALKEQRDTAEIPVLVVTAKWITPEDRAKLTGYVRRSSRKRTSTRIASWAKCGAPWRGACGVEMATVLVIEDNPANMTVAVFLLESVGHEGRRGTHSRRRVRWLHREADAVSRLSGRGCGPTGPTVIGAMGGT